MVSCSTNSNCVSKNGCPSDLSGICPDFRIKRYDTRPAFEMEIKDCNRTPINLENTVVEVSMWANARFKTAISDSDTYFKLADNIGFSQVLSGDIIVVSGNPRTPEQMLVTGFDETNYYIKVQRGYAGTPIGSYRKGTRIKIFRALNATGSTEMVYNDILQVDGTTEEDVLTKSKLVYEWNVQDTCLPGCYYLELKLLKMSETSTSLSLANATSSVTPSFTTVSGADLGCELGEGVEWVRRFPVEKEGHLIEIIDSPTSEALV